MTGPVEHFVCSRKVKIQRTLTYVEESLEMIAAFVRRTIPEKKK
jgi:hypothetical protein